MLHTDNTHSVCCSPAVWCIHQRLLLIWNTSYLQINQLSTNLIIHNSYPLKIYHAFIFSGACKIWRVCIYQCLCNFFSFSLILKPASGFFLRMSILYYHPFISEFPSHWYLKMHCMPSRTGFIFAHFLPALSWKYHNLRICTSSFRTHAHNASINESHLQQHP